MNKEKEYFSIGEISKKTSIASHTLRYWEKEGLIKSVRSGNSQRRYRLNDIDTIQKIKDKLYVEKYTIEGVKKYLRSANSNTLNVNLGPENNPEKDKKRTELFKEIKSTLKETLSVLDDIIKKNGV